MAKGSSPKIYGVLGYPVKHSFSPAMHNAAFRALKINADYRLFEVKPEDLDTFLSLINEKNIFGLNITIPYKEKILQFAPPDQEFFYLRQLKAVNTIKLDGSTWKGFNTDIGGFSRHLKESFVPFGKKAAILGAGGAARAVAYVLANSGICRIDIFDIDKAKAEELAKTIKNLFLNFEINAVDSIGALRIKDKDLLVNATPVGLKESDPCLVGEEMLHKDLFVYDLIYNPAQTKLLVLAKHVGAKTANGLGMLLYQGMLSFKIWTGQDGPQEIMWQALQGELNARNRN